MEQYREFIVALRLLYFNLARHFIGKAGEVTGTKIKPQDGTPVTSLDHYALAEVRRVIKWFFPDDYTIGEEDQRSKNEMRHILRRHDQYQWTIDGLDGTGNLLLGTNSYGSMISRRKGSDILFAAGFRPVDFVLRHNGFFYAVKGAGAFERYENNLNERQLRTARPGDLERMTVLLEGSSKKFFRPPISNLGAVETTRASLSSFVAATTVARGRASALVTIENAPWDNWPSMLFITEAGGLVSTLDGGVLWPHDCGSMIAAANETDHQRIIEILNRKEK